MRIKDDLLEELINLQGEIYKYISNGTNSKDQLESLLRNIEKRRFNILEKVKVYNKSIENEDNKIDSLDSRYIASYDGSILRVYIPETMPKFKQINNFTYKRIMLNIAEITKAYKEAFLGEVFIYIKIYDNQTNWDVDNKFIKPISDGLILSEVIKDDNINAMFYMVRGFYADHPHTEVYVVDSEYISDFLAKME